MDILHIVVPCFNEQECLNDSALKLKDVLTNLIYENKISKESKIVFVDDGSKDKTWEIIKELNKKEKTFYGVKLSRNKGHQNAVVAGISHSVNHADMIITIDADLQDDINSINEMIDKYHEGNQIVYGVRTSRDTDTSFKRNTANAYYKVLEKMGVEIINNHADYRLMSKRVCEEFLKYNESNLFLRGIVPQLGFKSAIVGYERKERLAGTSKYPLKKMLALAWNGITSFSLKPLKFISFLGGLITILSTLVTLVFSILFICNVLKASLAFYILLSIWFVGGLILLMMGLLGEYVGKTYQEVKHRPRFIIEEVVE